MDFKDIPLGQRYEFSFPCCCGKTYDFLTQKYDAPEYYVEIYLLCACGEYVKLFFPVN